MIKSPFSEVWLFKDVIASLKPQWQTCGSGNPPWLVAVHPRIACGNLAPKLLQLPLDNGWWLNGWIVIRSGWDPMFYVLLELKLACGNNSLTRRFFMCFRYTRNKQYLRSYWIHFIETYRKRSKSRAEPGLSGTTWDHLGPLAGTRYLADDDPILGHGMGVMSESCAKSHLQRISTHWRCWFMYEKYEHGSIFRWHLCQEI